MCHPNLIQRKWSTIIPGSIRHQTFDIYTCNAIEAQRSQHWFVVRAIQIYDICTVSMMTVLVP